MLACLDFLPPVKHAANQVSCDCSARRKIFFLVVTNWDFGILDNASQLCLMLTFVIVPFEHPPMGLE